MFLVLFEGEKVGFVLFRSSFVFLFHFFVVLFSFSLKTEGIWFQSFKNVWEFQSLKRPPLANTHAHARTQIRRNTPGHNQTPTQHCLRKGMRGGVCVSLCVSLCVSVGVSVGVGLCASVWVWRGCTMYVKEKRPTASVPTPRQINMSVTSKKVNAKKFASKCYPSVLLENEVFCILK